MADPQKIVDGNADGDFFVDTTCINCDTCRQLAPESFEDDGDYSRVYRQPRSEEERKEATRALISCPTGSIGDRSGSKVNSVIEDFPLLIDGNVYYCGFNSPKSYGGNSFLILDKEGNWMVDSPRFTRSLVKRIEALGGLSRIFLTHEDDVADAASFAKYFGAERIIHREALHAEPDAEVVLEGFDSVEILPSFLLIPTPGHTLGHVVLLYRNKYLFTGDHLYLDRTEQSAERRLEVHGRHCWYSYEELTDSVEKLLEYDFEWILAGHGDRGYLPRERVKEQLKELVNEMRADESNTHRR